MLRSSWLLLLNGLVPLQGAAVGRTTPPPSPLFFSRPDTPKLDPSPGGDSPENRREEPARFLPPSFFTGSTSHGWDTPERPGAAVDRHAAASGRFLPTSIRHSTTYVFGPTHQPPSGESPNTDAEPNAAIPNKHAGRQIA